MGFQFQYLCDLLSSLESNRTLKAATEYRSTDPDIRVVSRWFTQHGKRLRHADTDQLAVLSCLFPEKRTDRVYMLQDVSLSRVIGRCLLLGSSRREELERWRLSGGADLGQCVENVMQQAENHLIKGQEVTVEEIDSVLTQVASRSKFSGPRVRRQRTAVDVEEALSPIYRRLSSRDAKWLTRMILKSYYPVAVPERLAFRSFHFLLPRLLLFQDSFEAALRTLSTEPLVRFPAHPDPGQVRDLGMIALRHLKPVTGVKIGRPDYWKARSIKHCCRMIGGRRMSIEKKYDGEYCQIHIDLANQQNPIQIFSKSGKDSTQDRSGINEVLQESLRLKSPDCKFSRRCILEGELVVWSDDQRKILDFHKLRKFISRSGTFIGAENDSQPHPNEHLMIVFFDVLLLDDDVCLRKPHRERRLLLKQLVKVINGRADISEQRVLDFSHHGTQSRLEALLAKGISERWEGFILKACEDPYFTFFAGEASGAGGRWIKLKKDYIPGLGDTVDLTIIGSSYNARDAAARRERQKKVLWTHFFLGCLVNKESVLQFNVRPKFRVIDVIDHNGISPHNMGILNQMGEFSSCEVESNHGFVIEPGHDSLPKMTTVFRKPFVVEMLGGGFEKPSGARYFTLRFPRILKIHSDRSFEEAASFRELQLLADDARAIPSDELVEEEHEWSKRLKLSDGSAQYIVDRSQSVTTTTTSSSQTASCMASEETSTTVCNPGRSGGASSQIRQEQCEVHRSPTHISICIDTSMSSSPRSNVSSAAGHYLTSNENLSSNPTNFQQKKDLSTADIDAKPAAPARRPSDDFQNLDSSSLVSSLASSHPTREPKTRKQIMSQSNTKHTLISTPHASKNHSESPLSTVPIFYDGKPARDDNVLLLANFLTTTSSLDTFLTALQSQVKHETLPLIGLVLLNLQKTPLGPFLLHLSKSLFHQLQLLPKETESTLTGKILILDYKFLKIPAATEDIRFSFQETWDNIGKEYFYASVNWVSNSPLDSGDIDAVSKEIEKGKYDYMNMENHIELLLPVSEIPGTPISSFRTQTQMPLRMQMARTIEREGMNSDRDMDIASRCTTAHGDQKNESPSKVLISVSFDREELRCLGK